jgi:hypothetical protein
LSCGNDGEGEVVEGKRVVGLGGEEGGDTLEGEKEDQKRKISKRTRQDFEVKRRRIGRTNIGRIELDDGLMKFLGNGHPKDGD